MTTDVRLLNYCSDAIDDLRHIAVALHNLTPHTARHANIVADMLREATKFILPNCARLIDLFSIGDSHLELLRLPYPIVAFEAPWENEKEVEPTLNGYRQHKSSRRIALCWELDENFIPFPSVQQSRIHAAFPDGGIFIFPIFYIDRLRSWQFGAGGALCRVTSGPTTSRSYRRRTSSTAPCGKSGAHQERNMSFECSRLF
ncbi:hypothetical protein ACFQVB_39195 [Paraburkholderia humisilvae]|uniref:hypothetical protein n=1 Tax=Paraburkholderia humisilvae TaxID=627669 RepID=UPI003610ECB7